MSTSSEDLILIEQAGRRCAGCQTGRQWRRFEVLRPEGRDPVVACPACRPRLEEAIRREAETAAAAAAAATTSPATRQDGEARHDRESRQESEGPVRPRRRRRATSPQREDRLKRTLRELPVGTHSTGHIAKAAGLNETKVLARLRVLEEAGEVQRVGKKWSTERPSTDLEAAFERLQARTGNLRIIRPQKNAR